MAETTILTVRLTGGVTAAAIFTDDDVEFRPLGAFL